MIGHSEILKPVVVLIGWTLVMLGWLAAVRFPAMRRAGIHVTKLVGVRADALSGKVPDRTLWPGHNYDHLLEQPTLFYAAALTLAFTGWGNGINATIAWAYVGLRIVHSIVQATWNRVIVRVAIFALATLCLIALTLHAAMAVFGWMP